MQHLNTNIILTQIIIQTQDLCLKLAFLCLNSLNTRFVFKFVQVLLDKMPVRHYFEASFEVEIPERDE
jgi:hypothetical protein